MDRHNAWVRSHRQASFVLDEWLLVTTEDPLDVKREGKNRSSSMAFANQAHPEYWPPVHQLMHAGWYRAGAPWDSDNIEWGLRFVHGVDAETALRWWITAVDEDGCIHEVSNSGDDGSCLPPHVTG
jgi:hypothetical protein